MEKYLIYFTSSITSGVTLLAIILINYSNVVDDKYEVWPLPGLPNFRTYLAKNSSNWAIGTIAIIEFPEEEDVDSGDEDEVHEVLNSKFSVWP